MSKHMTPFLTYVKNNSLKCNSSEHACSGTLSPILPPPLPLPPPLLPLPPGLVSLNLLNLSGNLFSSVPSHLPPSIQQLYLSNNSLSGLGEESLQGFTNLR